MSGSKLKYQLLLRPQIERLLMPSTAQIPDMNAAPILATREQLVFLWAQVCLGKDVRE